MSFSSESFTSSTTLELKLEAEYVSVFQTELGMPAAAAKREFRELIDRVKREAKEQGTAELPANYGDFLLEQEGKDQQIKQLLSTARAEGARDDDLRWWWNLHDLERRIILEIQRVMVMAHYLALCKKGLSPDQAAERVKRTQPLFGNPHDESVASGDDRPLSYALKNRINTWISTYSSNSVGKLDPGNLTSFNALVRREIRNGNI